jgi:hypothetical protein
LCIDLLQTIKIEWQPNCLLAIRKIGMRSRTDTQMTAAAFSFFGVVIGAFLQYYFTRHLDRQKHSRELRATAYTDYLECVSQHANLATQPDSEEGRALGFRTADAKCRICLYGSSLAINAFANFERLGPSMGTPEQRLAFTRMVLVMRNDSARGGHVDLAELQAILLGNAQ